MNYESYRTKYIGANLLTGTLRTIYDFCKTVIDEIEDLTLYDFCSISCEMALDEYRELGYCVDCMEGMVYPVGNMVGVPWMDKFKDFSVDRLEDVEPEFLFDYVLHDDESHFGRVLPMPGSNCNVANVQDVWNDIGCRAHFADKKPENVSFVSGWGLYIDLLIDLALRCTSIATIPYRIYIMNKYNFLEDSGIIDKELIRDLTMCSTVFVNTVFRQLTKPFLPIVPRTDGSGEVMYIIKADIITSFDHGAPVNGFTMNVRDVRLVEKED